MADHDELVKEMSIVDRMSTAERYEYAKKRRREQLDRYFASIGDDESTVDGKYEHNRKLKRAIKLKFQPDIIVLEAAARNDIDEVRQLLETKINPNVTNCDGLTALHQAVIDNCVEMCQVLLKYNADVNAKDKELWTPLHAACMCGHVDIAKILIGNGADVVALNIDGLMPCDMAEDEAMVDYIDNVMENKGYNEDNVLDIRNKVAKEMLQDVREAIALKRDLHIADDQGATALHIACANGYYDVTEHLLKHGAKVNVSDQDGWQPIHAAACWGQDNILELLVKYGANVEAETDNNEKPFDLCEDPETKRLLTLLKKKAEQQLYGRRSSSTSRPRSNSRSQAIKRLSLSEKSKVSYTEAIAEAKIRSELTPESNSDESEGKHSSLKVTALKPNNDVVEPSDVNFSVNRPEGHSNLKDNNQITAQDESEAVARSNHSNLVSEPVSDQQDRNEIHSASKSEANGQKRNKKGCCVLL